MTAEKKTWVPDRQDIIWIDYNSHIDQEAKNIHPIVVLSPKLFNEKTGIVIGLPIATTQYNETNPFAIKFTGSKEKNSYILAHQPTTFDWKMRDAKPHPLKRVSNELFASACETLNQIIDISSY